MGDSFPRQYARTQRFTLGEPRNVAVSADGQRVIFLRSRSGDDPVNCLWVHDVALATERLVADPHVLLHVDQDNDALSTAERALRERMREGAGGITSFATDAQGTVVAFSLSGRLFVAGLISGTARELAVFGPVFDPCPDPQAKRLAYLAGRSLRIAELDGSNWELAFEEDPNVSWGAADFIAAEEMGRFRGYWWSPDGSSIAACRVDVSPVQQWHIADPANPQQQPVEIRYPAAGTANPQVTLHVVNLDGGSIEVSWDQVAYPYLAEVRWVDADRLLLTVQSRDQDSLMVLEANSVTGDTAPLWADGDAAWVELVPGTPRMLDGQRLVAAADRGGARRLMVDGQPVTPADLQVRSIVAVSSGLTNAANPDDQTVGTVTFLANPLNDPTVQHVWQWSDQQLIALTTDAGIHTAAVGGTTTVIRRLELDQPGSVTSVNHTAVLTSFAETPLVVARPSIRRYGKLDISTAVLLPAHHDGSPLPVLMDPYGGPHAQRVLASNNAYLSSQWFADQGFAVIIADGRGTPGRGSEWEREVHLDLATAPLDDQVAALHAAANEYPLDLSRVAIRGWSFGGYLAALAVLRRPDVFHAAIAGAPVTDWQLYDTHYTERYLGNPMVDSAPYHASSLIDIAHQLTRPLLLIHGLADDNVVAAHTLRLSSALLAAGKAHEVLPLVGVTHMTPQEVVAENLLLHQLEFLRRSLTANAGG